jgi:hypothetical protein
MPCMDDAKPDSEALHGGYRRPSRDGPDKTHQTGNSDRQAAMTLASEYRCIPGVHDRRPCPCHVTYSSGFTACRERSALPASAGDRKCVLGDSAESAGI